MAETQTKNRMKHFILLSIFFTILQITDIILTRFALEGGLREGNPLLTANINLLLPAKIVGVGLIFIIAYRCERKYNVQNTLIAPIIFMGGVIVWNISQIFLSDII